MHNFSEECIRLLTHGAFVIHDPGPLHQPIRSFSIYRDDKLRLILETEACPTAKSSTLDQQPGTIRINTDATLLSSADGIDGQFIGVISDSVVSKNVGTAEHSLKEFARVHIAKTNNPTAAPSAYVIDWLENLPVDSYIWPAGSKVVTRRLTTRKISLDDGITVASDSETYSFKRNCAKLVVDGVTFYVCALDKRDQPGANKPGCIVYDGTPDEDFRKKVRIALSFALGLYFVHLGTTHYDSEWQIVSTLARSAYSLGSKAFDIQILPFAPLGQNYENELNTEQLTRTVQALVTEFDTLDLANLHWAFWHACAAPLHFAPAHFGAAIEGLQRAYINANQSKMQAGLVPREVWKELRNQLSNTIDSASFSDEAKTSMKDKLNSLNDLNQRQRLGDVMAALELQLGSEENAAWRRRNKAAHGMPIPEGQELEALRDVKLLRGLFQRLLLRATNAAEQYIDYASPGYYRRNLGDPPPDNSGATMR